MYYSNAKQITISLIQTVQNCFEVIIVTVEIRNFCMKKQNT